MWEALGETAIIYASIRRTCKENGWTPNDVLESILDRGGTYLFPLFNFGFCHGHGLDVNAPSNNGILSEAARLHPAAVRVAHPIVGFAVIGPDADEYGKLNNYSGFGEGSAFELVLKNNGQSVAIDLPESMSMTHYHHIEEINDVDYRFLKHFSYNEFDAGLFVRHEDVVTHVDLMGERLWHMGLYSGNRPGINDGMRAINTRDMFVTVSDVIQSGQAKGLLWRGRKPFDC